MKFKYVEEEIKGDNDLPDVRKFLLSDGKEVIAYREGAHGFWKLKYEHGMMSPKLRGQFTTFEKALTEAKAYFKSTRDLDVVEVTE